MSAVSSIHMHNNGGTGKEDIIILLNEDKDVVKINWGRLRNDEI